MHDRVWSCIVSTAQTWTVGVTGATGYAGGEVCRLLAGHPNLRLAGVHANSSAGRRLGELQPHLCPTPTWWSSPATPASLAGYDVVVLALPHGESAADRRAAPRRHPRHRLRRRPPAERPRRVGPLVRRRARRLLALRPAGAARSAGEAGRRPPDRRPRLLPDLGHPRHGPGARRRADRARGRRRRASGTSGAGKSAKPHLLGSEVMGSVSAYGVGGVHRHTPEMIQNLSQAAGAPVSVSFTPTLVPMSRGILATCSAKLTPGTDAAAARGRLREGLRRRAVRPPAARGAVADHRRRCSARTPSPCSSPSTPTPAGWSSSPPSTTSPRAPRRRAAVRQPRPRSARDHRPSARRSRASEPSRAPKGFSAAGVAAGLKSAGDPDVAVVLNHGPDDAAAAVFTTNRFPAAPVLWSRQVLAGERARAVVLNSGGANACTGPEGFQDTHATAEHAAARARHRRDRHRRRVAPG